MADSNWSVRIGTRVTDDIQKQLDTMPKKTVTVKAVLDNTGLKTIGTTELTKYEDALGNVVVANKKFDASGKELNNTIKSVKSTVDTTSQTLQTASKYTKTLGQDFIDTAGKVAKFGAITAIFGLVTSAIGSAVNVVKEFDSAMTEFNKVSDISGSNLDSYTEKLGELGTEIARTRTQMVEASTEFVKSGYTEEQSAQLAKVAGLYQNVADSEITAGESSAYLISQMKAFNITATDAVSIIDKTNEVANRFAVSSTDISTALTKTASTFATYGNSIDETMAMVVGATELLPNQAGKVSKGLSSIGAEIVKLANESGKLEYNVKGVSKSLSLFDDAGNMLNTFDTLSAIKDDWDAMSKAEQSALALTLGMKTQIPVFTAEMNNFDTVLSAVGVSLGSNGSAMQENEAYMESLKAKTNALKAQFELLVLGDGGLQSFIKGLVDAGVNILKFINDIGGLPTILLTIASAIGIIKGEEIATSILKLIELIPTLITGIKTLGWTYEDGALKITASNTAMVASIPIIGLILTAITALSAGIGLYSSSLKKAQQAREDVISNAESEIKTLESVKKQLNNESLTIDSLNSIVDSNISKYSDEINKINDLNEARKKSIDYINQEIQANAKQITTTGGVDYTKALKGMSDDVSNRFTKLSAQASTKILGSEQLNALISASGIKFDTSNLENYKNSISDLIDYIQNLDEGTNTYKNILKILSDEYESADSDLTDYKNTIQRFDDALAVQGEVWDKNTNKVRSMTTLEHEEYEQRQNNNNAIQDSTDVLSENEDELDNDSTTIETASERLSNLSKQTSNTISSLDTLNNALLEQQKNGSLSVDTTLDLIDKGYALALSFDEQTGACTLNKNAMIELVTAKIKDQEADLVILQNDIQTKLKEDGIVAAKSAEGFLVLAKAKSESTLDYVQRTGGNSSSYGASNQEDIDAYNDAEAQKKALEASLKNLKSIGTSTYGGISKSAGSAAKSSTDAWKEAYEDEKDALDHKLEMEEISQEDYYKQLYALNEKYFNDTSEHHKQYLDDYQKNEEAMYKGVKKMLEDMADDVKDKLKEQEDAALDSIDIQIDAVNDAKDAALDAIDAQISAIKKEKEARLNAIDDELEALKTEQDAVETYWNNRIDAFKKANEELDKQNKLMEYQEALAKAQSTQVKIFQGGQFTYGQDQEAVDEAQENLDEYQDELKYEEELQALEDSRDAALAVYDQKIADLESYRDSVESYYESEIEAMEAHRDEVQEQYDAELEALETQKEETKKKYEEMIENYENTEKALFDTQVNAITSENQNWTVRLQNLADFVKNYNAMLSQLGSANTNVKSSYSGTSVKTKATGDSSINNSGAYIVGENPNKEIVIGSKLNNNGTLMNLSKGSGVVNAKSTSTLAGLLNNLGAISGIGAGLLNNLGGISGIGATSNNNTTKSVNNNFNITANVQDGAGLVDYLQNFSSRMTQEAFAQ